MYKKLKIVKVNSKYCDYLRKYDCRVPFNAGSKELRPFIGVLFKINDCEYFAPLSSPKIKHKKLKNTLDLIKIKNGKYGVINFNNMIPVYEEVYSVFDLNNKPIDTTEIKRFELLNNQLRWINENRKEILLKSKLLYHLYTTNKLPDNVKSRCCNFLILEKNCLNYKKSQI